MDLGGVVIFLGTTLESLDLIIEMKKDKKNERIKYGCVFGRRKLLLLRLLFVEMRKKIK